MYDADYFLHGRQSGKSLYEDYRWLPGLTIPMVQSIIKHLNITKNHSILDFGAARGYTVKAFRELGYECYGIDTSKWAIENCDPDVVKYVTCTSEIPPEIDWIIVKDVFEHIPQVVDTITALMHAARKGIFVVVPLSSVDGAPYVIPDYELDITHIHRFTLATWIRFFMQHGWEVTASYRIRGIKDNYHGWLAWVKKDFDLWRHGNGFITARRI